MKKIQMFAKFHGDQSNGAVGQLKSNSYTIVIKVT